MDYRRYDNYKIEVRKKENKKFLQNLRQTLINKNIPFNIINFETSINELKKILYFNSNRINLKKLLNLREIKKMTNYNGFKLSGYLLDTKLKSTIKKILSLNHKKILDEIILILLNCFNKQNFRDYFKRDFFEEFNFIIVKCDFIILKNIFKILKKINLEGSDLILEKFDLEKILMRFKNNFNEFDLIICKQINFFIYDIIKKLINPDLNKLKILMKFRKKIFIFVLDRNNDDFSTYTNFLNFIEILLIKINFKIKDQIIFYMKEIDLFQTFFDFIELSYLKNFEDIEKIFKILINILTKCDNNIFLKEFFFSFKNQFIFLLELFKDKNFFIKMDYLLIIYGNFILTDKDICNVLYENNIYDDIIFLINNQNNFKLEILFVLEALLLKLNYDLKKELFSRNNNILELIFSLVSEKTELDCIYKLLSILEILINYKNDIFAIVNYIKFNDKYQKIIKEISSLDEIDENLYCKFIK